MTRFPQIYLMYGMNVTLSHEFNNLCTWLYKTGGEFISRLDIATWRIF